MSKTITDQFRALCQRAEAKATTTYARKRDAELTRHEKRLAELQQERDAEISKAQAALRAVEGEAEGEGDDETVRCEACSTRGRLTDPGWRFGPEDSIWLCPGCYDAGDSDADAVQLTTAAPAEPPPDEVPAALREPYKPRAGKAGA